MRNLEYLECGMGQGGSEDACTTSPSASSCSVPSSLSSWLNCGTNSSFQPRSSDDKLGNHAACAACLAGAGPNVDDPRAAPAQRAFPEGLILPQLLTTSPTIRRSIPATRESIPMWSAAYAGQSIHLIGIGGCGMRGLAVALMRCGARVSGSDRCESRTVQQLRDAGVTVHIGQSPTNIPSPCDKVVYSAAVHAENPELVAARSQGITVFKYAEMLGQVMKLRKGVAVAGTHGKSTTTALTAFILKEAGLDPSFVVGAGVEQLGGGAGVGEGDHFVVEACEFDRSFLNYTPELAAILNIEEDHLDCYTGLDAIVEAFAAFASRVQPGGVIVANGEDRAVERAVGSAAAAVETFGFSPLCTWSAADVASDTGLYRFTIQRDGRPFAAARLGALAGRHQVLNALAATALAYHAGVPINRILHGLSEFRGAHRRLTLRGQGRGITVLDDYGHHPTEIQATLRAIRERYPGRRIWLVFQPHQHSRTRFLLNDFARCFGQADQVLLPDIYFVRDSQAERDAICTRDLVERIHANGGNACYMQSFDAIVGYIHSEARAGDVVVTMGAGDVWKIADDLVRRLT